jgi:hypothetical protein
VTLPAVPPVASRLPSGENESPSARSPSRAGSVRTRRFVRRSLPLANFAHELRRRRGDERDRPHGHDLRPGVVGRRDHPLAAAAQPALHDRPVTATPVDLSPAGDAFAVTYQAGQNAGPGPPAS